MVYLIRVRFPVILSKAKGETVGKGFASRQVPQLASELLKGNYTRFLRRLGVDRAGKCALSRSAKCRQVVVRPVPGIAELSERDTPCFPLAASDGLQDRLRVLTT